MGDVVNRHPIQQNEVLIGAAPAYVQAVLPLPPRLYARQQLQGLEHVHFAQQCRYALDLLHGHINAAHLGALFDARAAFDVGHFHLL